jgi:hypothetical protein
VDELPLPPENTAPAARYGGLVCAVVSFTGVAAVGAYALAFGIAEGSPDTAESGISLLGLIVTGIWAAGSWSKIKQAEPEGDPKWRRKHHAFSINAGIAVVAVLIGAGGLGTVFGIGTARQTKLNELAKQVAALGAKAAPYKQRFIEAATRNTEDQTEYLQRCADLKAAINDYGPALQQLDGLLREMQEELQNFNGEPKFDGVIMSVNAMRSILRKDMEAIGAYSSEVAYASQLATVSKPDQLRFYDTNIQPIVDREAKIAKEEVEIVKDAKARGVKLPEQLYSQMGIN